MTAPQPIPPIEGRSVGPRPKPRAAPRQVLSVGPAAMRAGAALPPDPIELRRRGGGGGPPSGPRVPITRRPVAQRRLTGRVLLVVLVAAVMVGVAVWAVFFSSLLAIRTVEVRGLSTVSRESVVDAAGIELGTPLARLDNGGVVEQVGGIPAVARVEVSRHWPHTVVLTVTERTPAIAVPRGGMYAIYDETGVLFRTESSAPAGVPQLNSDEAPSAERVDAVLEVVRALPAAVAARLTAVRADSLDSIQLALDNGAVSVVWGSAESSARKAEVLVPLMEHPALVYDVSAPEVPVTRE